MSIMKNGSKGETVKELQGNLLKLGFDVQTDGSFGPNTEKSVRDLQRMFGYTVDGIVGEGTGRLIEAQLGYGWNAKARDAEERALRAQGKSGEADALKAKLGAAPMKGAPMDNRASGKSASAK